MTRRMVIGVAVGLPLLAVAVRGLAGLGGAPALPTAIVERRTFARTVVADGALRAVDSTPISLPADAEQPFKIAWLIADGSRVKAGDVVARFDPTDLTKELTNGRSDQSTADQHIGKARSLGDATLRNLDRDSAVAAAELENARHFQSKDAELYSHFEIVSSAIDAELASKKKEYSETVKATKARASAAEMELLGLERRKAEIAISRAEKALGVMALTAPHDGLVVFVHDWRGDTPRVGETLWASEKIAEIPRLDTMEAEVFVLEADAGGLVVGQLATVLVEGRPDRPIKASALRVDAIAKTHYRGSPVQYFGVVLKLARTDPESMKPGQRVQATLTLTEQADALTVPRQAVFEKQGKKLVYRWSRWHGFEPVEVVLGSTALGRVVVEKGLAAGQQVALVDPSRGQAQPAATPSAAPAVGGQP